MDIRLTQSFIVTVLVTLTPWVLAVALRTISIRLSASRFLTSVVALASIFGFGSAVLVTTLLNIYRRNR